MTKHTQNLYTSNKKSDAPRNAPQQRALVELAFQGDSIHALRSFPDAAKNNLGYALECVQRGQSPLDRKMVRSVGPGVYELRDEDQRAWYRILYVRGANKIYVLHCFEKRSNLIEQKDIATARARLKRVLEAEREEKRNAKQALRRK